MFSVSDITLITLGIEKRVGSAFGHPGELALHSVIASVSAQEDIARQYLQHLKHCLVVLRDLADTPHCSPACIRHSHWDFPRSQHPESYRHRRLSWSRSCNLECAPV